MKKLKNLVLAGLMLVSASVSAQRITLSDLITTLNHGDDVEDVQDNIGQGRLVDGKLIIKIEDEVNNKEVISRAYFDIRKFKTWYNSDYFGIYGGKIEIVIPSNIDSDGGYDWDWSVVHKVKRLLRSEGFEEVDGSDGSKTSHFYVFKKDNRQVRIDISAKYVDGRYSKTRTKVTFQFEEEVLN